MAVIKNQSVLKMLCLLTSVALGGCSTIHFTQDPPQLQAFTPVKSPNDTAHVYSQWHDSTLDGMIELSPPVNLYKKCDGKPWTRVTSELTFTNGLVAALVSGAVTSVAPVLEYVNLYTPWTVEVACE